MVISLRLRSRETQRSNKLLAFEVRMVGMHAAYCFVLYGKVIELLTRRCLFSSPGLAFFVILQVDGTESDAGPSRSMNNGGFRILAVFLNV